MELTEKQQKRFGKLKQLIVDPYWMGRFRDEWKKRIYVEGGEHAVQAVPTPPDLCQEIVAKLKGYTTISGKSVLTLNVEFIPFLLDAGELWFFADNEEKAVFVEQFYPSVKILKGYFLECKDMKHFDVVAMNPPYQLSDGGNSASAKPLYQRFIEKVIDELKPDYLLSINPSRWMVGGKGLDDFRKKMIADRRIKIIVHFPGNNEIFTEVSITGGVNYFIWDKTHNGTCEFVVGNTSTDRNLDEFDIVVQDNNAIKILKKIISQSNKWIDKRCISRKPFDLATNFSNWQKSGTPCYSTGRKINFVSPNDFTDKHNIVGKWKVATSKANGAAQEQDNMGAKRVLSNAFVIEPGAVCTETYIVVNVFNTRSEAENFISYVKTKFFRFMLGLRVLTQDINKEKFAWVPDLDDYSKSWTDQELYEKFGLTRQERAYIESKIKEIQ